MSVITQDIAPVAQVARTRGYWGGVARRLSRDPVSVACAVILLLRRVGSPRPKALTKPQSSWNPAIPNYSSSSGMPTHKLRISMPRQRPIVASWS